MAESGHTPLVLLTPFFVSDSSYNEALSRPLLGTGGER